MAVLLIQKILHDFEDQRIANFLNLEQVTFSVTLVIQCTVCQCAKSEEWCRSNVYLQVLLAIHLVSGYGAPWWDRHILEKTNLGTLDTVDYYNIWKITITHSRDNQCDPINLAYIKGACTK